MINWKLIMQSCIIMSILVVINVSLQNNMSFESVLLLTILGNSFLK